MKHTIYTKNEQDRYPLAPSDRALVKRAITAALAYEGFTEAAEVSVSFVDDDAIHALNRAFRGKDSATDVLSFPMVEDDEAFDCDEAQDTVVLGDIVISMEHAAAQAEQYGHSLQRELAFLAVHSTLHLLGYDHEKSPDEEKDMFARQEAILRGMGLERPANKDKGD